MKSFVIIIGFLLPFFSWSQKDSIQSGVYSWKTPALKKGIGVAILFDGKVQDMEKMQMSATVFQSSTSQPLIVPANEEGLLLIKSGTLHIVLHDSDYTIGPGSIALMMPNEHLIVQNTGNKACEFYLLRYRSKLPKDAKRGKAAGGSLVRDWNSIAFKPHDKGGRRDFLERPTAMCRRMEIHVSTLNPGLKSHDPHTHRAEEIVLVTEGETEMQIRDGFYKGSAGSIYYLGSNVSHAIQNKAAKPCTYFAIQFE